MSVERCFATQDVEFYWLGTSEILAVEDVLDVVPAHVELGVEGEPGGEEQETGQEQRPESEALRQA